MTNDQMLNNLAKEKRRVQQEKLNLKNTKACIEMLRNARTKELSMGLCHELYQLIKACAVEEWGPATTIDDFSTPEQFIVKNGRKYEMI